MITKKEQMIVDAVNYYRAEIPVDLTESYFFNVDALSKMSNFQLCSYEMEIIHGGIDYKKYIINCNNIGIDTTNKTLTKENSDYSFYEKEKENKMQNVYTQLMKDNGVLPSVGMQVEVDDSEFYIRDKSFIDTPLTVMASFVSLGNDDGEKIDMVALSKPSGDSDCFRSSICKPIDTRTPGQKQVDSAVQDIMNFMFDINEHDAKCVVEMLQSLGHLAEIIKPLELK